jgi:hypothetical protein
MLPDGVAREHRLVTSLNIGYRGCGSSIRALSTPWLVASTMPDFVANTIGNPAFRGRRRKTEAAVMSFA